MKYIHRKVPVITMEVQNYRHRDTGEWTPGIQIYDREVARYSLFYRDELDLAYDYIRRNAEVGREEAEELVRDAIERAELMHDYTDFQID